SRRSSDLGGEQDSRLCGLLLLDAGLQSLAQVVQLLDVAGDLPHRGQVILLAHVLQEAPDRQRHLVGAALRCRLQEAELDQRGSDGLGAGRILLALPRRQRSEEHTSELQSRENLVCRLLLEKKNYHATQIF